MDGSFVYYNQPDPQALPLRVADRLDLVFDVSGHKEIRVNARVVWSDILAVEESGILLGVGLRFLDVRVKDHQFLLQAITERMSRAKGDVAP